MRPKREKSLTGAKASEKAAKIPDQYTEHQLFLQAFESKFLETSDTLQILLGPNRAELRPSRRGPDANCSIEPVERVWRNPFERLLHSKSAIVPHCVDFCRKATRLRVTDGAQARSTVNQPKFSSGLRKLSSSVFFYFSFHHY